VIALARDLDSTAPLLAAVTDHATIRAQIRNALLLEADARYLPLVELVVDLTVTSPIYAARIAYAEGGDLRAVDWPSFMQAWLADLYRVTRWHGRLALNVPVDMTIDAPRVGRAVLSRPTSYQAYNAAIAAGWLYKATIMWDKNHHKKGNRGLGSVDRSLRPHPVDPTEAIILFTKGEWAPSSINRDDITHDEWEEYSRGPWRFPGLPRRKGGHPAPFPEELPRRCIKLLSRVGDVVYDPFLGSGTTAAVALDCGRRALGSDISAEYLSMAAERLARRPVRLPFEGCASCHDELPVGRRDRRYCSQKCRQKAYRQRDGHSFIGL
jgi:site-specific DNA-methyltransferase (adenine-specific)